MHRAADNIRILAAAMVEKAASGHPGGAMGGADFANVLYSRFITVDPDNPTWIARDRFFLDPGHMSPMLYAVLTLTGRYTLDELRQFRQWGSPTPGHPEVDPRRGIENTSGPLGQGHAMAVGAAIAERFLAARFGDIVSHYTYAFISDGGVQEEISQGAGRIAGHLGLNRLIMFYDSNGIQLSTTVQEVDAEDVAAKYRAWHWNVIEIDGNNPEAIAAALESARGEQTRPTLIIGHTAMGKGAVTANGESFEGKTATHGQPLSKSGADFASTVRNLGGNPDNPFVIFDETKALYDKRNEQLRKICADWRKRYAEWATSEPEKAAELEQWMSGRIPDIDYASISHKPDMATRTASSSFLQHLAEHIPNMIVSSADLANSDKTDGFIKGGAGVISRENPSGRFLHAGVSELSMAAIINGIALHGGLIAACGTFFVFSDYMKPAIRMAALMELPVKYIWSHDSFRVGEDGPTHEPIEQEAQIRLLEEVHNFEGRPSLLALRPADTAETFVCWDMAMHNDATPTALILSRQDLHDLPALEGSTRSDDAEQARRGAYIVIDHKDPQVVLVANGSEVSLLCQVAERMAQQQVYARVVSIPSIGLFNEQSIRYRQSILPPDTPHFGLTAGLPSTLRAIKGFDGDVFGLERFGASAPFAVLDNKFGFTAQNIFEKVMDLLKK